MLHHTRGIVIRNVKYSETSVICKIYTEAFGMQSYIVNGVRGAKAKSARGSLLQPLSLLQMVVYHRDHKNLQRIKEFSPAYIYQNLPMDIKRGTIGLFLAEVINKAVIEETENEALFTYLYDSLLLLDRLSPIANFHIYFLVELSRYLGFFPQRGMADHEHYMDMKEGAFVHEQPLHPNFMDAHPSQLLLQFMETDDAAEAMAIKANYAQRKVLLGNLLRYFEMHLDYFKNIQSHVILDAVFRH